MDNLLFISHYPLGDKIKEGMAQRIFMIDSEFSNYDRTYLGISYKSHLKKREYHYGKVTIIYCNYFLHWNLIYNYIKWASIIYCHSLLNLRYLMGKTVSGKRVILDVHGAVPEEFEFRNLKLRSKIFNFLEKKLFPKVTDIICVSDAMRMFYTKKYPNLPINQIIKPIMPSNSLRVPCKEKLLKLRAQLNISERSVVFIYSGNLQEWQNFDLMIEIISKSNNPNNVFIILTGQEDEARAKLSNLNRINIHIRSVTPEDLPEYYELAHYGFLLRDKITLNEVAAPTKLFEYLHFGITPIMKSLNVGDFNTYDCDYVTYDVEIDNLQPCKSEKNRKIAYDISTMAIKSNIPGMIEKSRL